MWHIHTIKYDSEIKMNVTHACNNRDERRGHYIEQKTSDTKKEKILEKTKLNHERNQKSGCVWG